MRLTIERLRTLVLVSGVVLVLALVGFLAFGRWKNRLLLNEVLHRLPANIQREQNGVTYTQAHGGHTLFKIHASNIVQLKQNGRAQLHDVWIELYGQDGSTVDRISGANFEYDQKAGVATAAGPVEIVIMRPREAPAIAHGSMSVSPKTPQALANAANAASNGQIDVKTSGLTFDQKTGLASTEQRVEFSIVQGQGSSVGATFDSDRGQLILDHDLELNVHRGAENVVLHAAHGEFDRNQLTCDLRGAAASYRNGHASAGSARILFREDGSAVRLDAQDGFALVSATGAKIAAPRGSLEFNERNQPTEGHLDDGVTMESATENRQDRGSAGTAKLAFAGDGRLRHAHLERAVTLHSEQKGPASERSTRDWNSPAADIDFRNAVRGQVQMASLLGTGGVVINGQTQRPGGVVEPSRMAADQVTGEFGDHQELTRMTGVGHASLEQTTASGVKQTTSGERVEAQFAPAISGGKTNPRTAGGEQIESATIDGSVVLTQQQPAKPGQPQSQLRATAGHAAYEGGSEWLHLTQNPRVDDGGLQLTADKLDVSQASGDAFAHGNVKATWLGSAGDGAGKTAPAGLTLGGQGPAHVIASEAQLHRATGEVTFHGQARLWQQANSISAPVIVLDQKRQTLVARSNGASQPVDLVLLSGSGLQAPGQPQNAASSKPSVIQVRAGDLKYSGAERKAMLHAGPLSGVLAQTTEVSTISNEVEIVLLPPGNHAGPGGTAAQLDRLTARGHVAVTSNGRRGTGEQLVYSNETGNYVLTGTSAAPPRLIDQAHGTVTGEALIFNSRDDSVSIEGQGQKTLTQTVAPK